MSRNRDCLPALLAADITATMTDPKRHAPATLRNRDPILSVLQRVLPPEGLVLETNSGSGEHAAYMAPRLAPRIWQPSDLDDAACASIAAYVAEAGLETLRPPFQLDVTWPEWPVEEAAAILSANMIHIAPWEACLGLLDGAARILRGDGALLFLYGPFKRGGEHTAPSNEAFDQSLRGQNPLWGIRNLDDVATEAAKRRLALTEIVDMPSNNFSAIFTQAT